MTAMTLLQPVRQPRHGRYAVKMQIDSITNQQVRQFYALYWPQREILHDFFSRLSESQFDFRMVATPERRADTPRESLAHILYVQLVYFDAVKSGTLEFKSLGVEHYREMTKAQLLAEWERIDEEMFAHLTGDGFDSNSHVAVFWGGDTNAIEVLYFLRDHAILHVGWNLALMDHLKMPRFDSLIRYWGP
jgi:uncharacterized damage-inducible protein DinB